MSVIEIKDLKKYFGKTKAVDGVSFEVQKGEIFGFLGPNGAGKTTTIRCLMDFLRPTSGQTKILGQDLKWHSDVKEKIGYLSGDVRMYSNWTGKEHITYLENLRGKQSIALDLSKKLNFDLNNRFKNLSSGNRQKLGLILALMFEPEVMILDEPTMGLDPLLQNTIYQILEGFQKKGSTIFMSSHNLAEVERICGRVAIIKDGKLVATENIYTLKEKHIYEVKVRFTGEFDRNYLNYEGIEIIQESNGGYILSVRGDINILLRVLAQYNIRDVEISRANLEDIFLEFYN